jgi:hypothetical protein
MGVEGEDVVRVLRVRAGREEEREQDRQESEPSFS